VTRRLVIKIVMKKIKSPWYGLLWIMIWTAALVYLLQSGMFNTRESIGLLLVWLTLVGITVYLLIQHLRISVKAKSQAKSQIPQTPSRNAACPCGSGKKYKRCCGAVRA